MRERRAFPRYPITFPVKFGLNGAEDNLKYESECADISRSSIQISCDSELVEALLASDEYPHTATLDFMIPEDKSTFLVAGHVVTHRRLSQNNYYLVLMFLDFHEGSDEQLVEDLKDFEPSGFRLGSN